jgi:gliding motility-associated-like protein
LRFIMKILHKLIILFFLVLALNTKAQVFYINGADVNIKQGAVVQVNGSLQNDNTGNLDVQQSGISTAVLTIRDDFINDATSGGNGDIYVAGDWINNSVFNAGTGSVYLNGANQLLGGIQTTVFYNLDLSGTGIKTQGINQSVSGVLSLNDRELATETFGMFVTNTSTTAITRTSGFVSSLNGGFLSRNTASISNYSFPVGSSQGTTRYRPIDMMPSALSANTYTVRMANLDAGTEGYDRNLLDTGICLANPNFYHQINRTSGSASVLLTYYYDEVVDGLWENLGYWTTSPSNMWKKMTTTNHTSATPFNYIQRFGWNDFSNQAYILLKPAIEIDLGPDTTICSGDVLTLDPGSGYSSYLWSNFTTNPTLNVSTTGTYSVTVSDGVCSAIDTIIITVINNADATITPAGPFCLGDPTYTLTTVDAGGVWSGTGVNASGVFDPNLAGSGTHQIIYTIAGPCGDADTIDIQVSAGYNATITPVSPLCSNDPPLTLSAVDPGGTWSGNGVNPTTGVFSPAVAGVGTHQIIYSIVASCGDADTIDIEVIASANATITPAGPFCEDDAPVSLTTAQGGGVWSGSGVNASGVFDPSSVSVGNHQVIYTIANPCGDADTINIQVLQNADATISAAGPFCENDPAVTLSAVDPGGTWSGNGINATTGVFNPSVAGTGIHQIIYTISSQCGDSDTVQIEVLPNADASITNPGIICISAGSVNLTAVDTGGTWSGTGVNASTGIFDPLTAGVGTHQIIYTIATQCGDADTINITVIDQQDASITAVGAMCSNESAVQLIAVDLGGVWTGNGVSSSGLFNPNTAGAGVHQIIYTIANPCGDADTIEITVHDTQSVLLGGLDESCIDANDGIAWVDIFGGTLPYSILWNNMETTDTIAPLSPGWYVVTVTDSNNCIVSDSVRIYASTEDCFPPHIYVPNIFSPNGDGNNDILYAYGHGIETLSLIIYNRWGEKVFETTDILIGWDGTYNGNKLDPAVFVYYLKAELSNGEIINQSGNISLVK